MSSVYIAKLERTHTAMKDEAVNDENRVIVFGRAWRPRVLVVKHCSTAVHWNGRHNVRYSWYENTPRQLGGDKCHTLGFKRVLVPAGGSAMFT